MSRLLFAAPLLFALASPASAQYVTVEVTALQARQAEAPPLSLVWRGASIAAPDPTAMGLLGAGMMSLGLLRYWRRRGAE